MKPNVILKILFTLAAAMTLAVCSHSPSGEKQSDVRLYWFIPDGMRADPDLFNVFEWARKGELPNIQRMMKEGSFGYSIPDFPSHTPTNFASLLTGTHPNVHGVADGPMHVEGHSLERPSLGGFSSQAKLVDPVWNYFEKKAKSVFLLSLPGSTPPELNFGYTVRGRWGGWGADTHKVIFESDDLLPKRKSFGRAFRLFFFGSKLTQFVSPSKNNLFDSKIVEHEKSYVLSAHGAEILAKVIDESFDKKTKFNKMLFSVDGKSRVAELKVGQWSSWTPISLKFRDQTYLSSFKVKLIQLSDSGSFRVRVLYDNLNEYITEPSHLAATLRKNVGPMVDFPDNWPPQLNFEKEDKQTFIDEATLSLDWHQKAAKYVLNDIKPDVFIHDTYTPNQMLESRWWMQFIEPTSPSYSKIKSKKAMKDVKNMYKKLDSILGEALSGLDPNKDVVVLSSDHGVCSLRKLVRLNNLFAKKGWLKFSIDKKTGEPKIDWKRTKVIYLKMANIYVNPNGLDGKWKRSKGKAYDQLRNEVIEAVKGLKDKNNQRPLARIVKWEEAEEVYKLPPDRVGDLILEANLNYFWYEEVKADLKIFERPITSGYKQTIDPVKNNCMWTPFLIWGKNIKAGRQIQKPIQHISQLPTILKAMGLPPPKTMQGKPIDTILKK